jgi:hypothetical protein
MDGRVSQVQQMLGGRPSQCVGTDAHGDRAAGGEGRRRPEEEDGDVDANTDVPLLVLAAWFSR